MWGGLVTGALTGLKADIATGGLTLGGGLLAGGVIGALTAAGAAHGINRVRGIDQPVVAWDRSVLDALLAAALLGYLAVAHHGRGRGAWVAHDPPAAWTAAVQQVLAVRRAEIDALWARRSDQLGRAAASPPLPAGDAAAPATAAVALALQGLLESASAELLARLYPEAGAALPA
jgi:hypothetical protein